MIFRPEPTYLMQLQLGLYRKVIRIVLFWFVSSIHRNWHRNVKNGFSLHPISTGRKATEQEAGACFGKS